MGSQHGDKISMSIARSIARSHRATYTAVRLTMDKQRAGVFFLAYSYFRWIDDIVDSDNASTEQKTMLLSRQRTLISRAYDDPEYASDSSLNDAERFLCMVIQYDTTLGKLGLRSPILAMLTSLEMDVQRRGQFVSGVKLRQIQHYRTTAYAEGVLTLLRRRPVVGEDNKLYLFAEACDEVHKLRDMLQDIAFGYYNISLEALKEYNIDLSNPDSPGFKEYVRTTVDAARDKFVRSRSALLHESLSMRAACLVYSLRHGILLHMIERDGYRLRPSYSLSLHELRRLLRSFAPLSRVSA